MVVASTKRVNRGCFTLAPGNSLFVTACLLCLLGGCSDNGPAAPKDAAPGRDNAVAATVVFDGKALFELHCSACHDPGPDHPGTMRLQQRVGAEQAALLHRERLPAEYIKLVVREGFKLMPPFRPTEITDSQLEELADYISGAAYR